MTVFIYSPDAVAALLTRHAIAFVGDGVRRLSNFDSITLREVVEEVIRQLNTVASIKERLILENPSELNWRDERDACLAIIAFLRTMLPAEPAATEVEARHG